MLITTDGVRTGEDAIQNFFEDFLARLTPEAKESFVANAEIVHDHVMVAYFIIGAWERTFHDTALIRDDRIMVLTTVSYPAE